MKRGFVSVPKGCYIHLEKKASEYVLQNIKSSIETRSGILEKIASFENDTGKALTLAHFLSHYRMSAQALYKKGSFSRLCVLAGVKEDFYEDMEAELTKALPRLASIDSRRLLKHIVDILEHIEDIDFNCLNHGMKRMLQMFYVSIWMEVIDYDHPQTAYENLRSLADNTNMREEMKALLQYRYEHIDIVDKRLEFGFDCPIDLHCTYSRDQILAALDFDKPSTVREGVKWLPNKKIDVLFVTLNKSDKDYSPTTMYKDYAINETMFHWQSQSTTSNTSPTGQRYIQHRKQGSKVLLCVREYKKDPWGNAAPYNVLGFADYLQHTGSKPMTILWRLEEEIPAKYMKQTRKLLAG